LRCERGKRGWGSRASDRMRVIGLTGWSINVCAFHDSQIYSPRSADVKKTEGTQNLSDRCFYKNESLEPGGGSSSLSGSPLSIEKRKEQVSNVDCDIPTRGRQQLARSYLRGGRRDPGFPGNFKRVRSGTIGSKRAPGGTEPGGRCDGPDEGSNDGGSSMPRGSFQPG
jgi:hypothetical protein